MTDSSGGFHDFLGRPAPDALQQVLRVLDCTDAMELAEMYGEARAAGDADMKRIINKRLGQLLAPQMRDAKWLDPECAAGGCQSLRFKAAAPPSPPVAAGGDDGKERRLEFFELLHEYRDGPNEERLDWIERRFGELLSLSVHGEQQ